MRAEGDALVAVVLLARDAHVPPAGTGGEDDGASQEHRAVVQAHLREPARLRGRGERSGPLQLHDLDLVGAHVLFEGRGQLGAFGVGNGDEVLDRHGVHDLSTEPLRDDAGANSLAGGVDCRGRASRATTDDEDVEGIHRLEPLRVASRRSAVELADDLLEGHPALTEQLAVPIDGRHRQHLARLDLALEGPTLDGDVGDPRVEDAHRVERLHDVGAVLASEGHVGLEVVLPLDRPDRRRSLLRDLRGDAANLQQGEDQRRELVPERHAGEAHLDIGAGPLDGEGRLAGIVAGRHRDQCGQRRDLPQQLTRLGRRAGIVEAGLQLDRQGEPLQVGLQRGSEVRVEHGRLLAGRGRTSEVREKPSGMPRAQVRTRHTEAARG